MGCPPVREDNPRALASGLSYVQADNPLYNYFITPTLVYTLHNTGYFVLKLVSKVVSSDDSFGEHGYCPLSQSCAIK